MLASVLKRRLAAFGARYDYDTSYLKELADLDPGGTAKLAMVSAFTGHRFGLPPAPYHAAKAVAAKSADCGPCLELAVAMGTEAGVDRADLARILTGRVGEAPDGMALAARYADAVLANGDDLADLLAECETRWGRRGVAGLAAAVVSGLFYPMLKRGLGHGLACRPVIASLAAELERMERRETADA